MAIRLAPRRPDERNAGRDHTLVLCSEVVHAQEEADTPSMLLSDDPILGTIPAAGSLDALMTLNGGSMALGQVVPFEVVIEASGGTGPERGTVEFTADWSTFTTSNDRFGYDTNYMVYCAFVDYADPGTVDPHYNAKVESFRSAVINRGTIAEQIEGTFRVSGLDPGDRVVVEIWVVLDSTPPRSGGTVAAGLVSAQKATVPPEPISTGVQTTGLGNLNKLNPLPPVMEPGEFYMPYPVEVQIGGATVFALEVERFVRL